jgi:hypothetical protein
VVACVTLQRHVNDDRQLQWWHPMKVCTRTQLNFDSKYLGEVRVEAQPGGPMIMLAIVTLVFQSQL